MIAFLSVCARLPTTGACSRVTVNWAISEVPPVNGLITCNAWTPVANWEPNSVIVNRVESTNLEGICTPS